MTTHSASPSPASRGPDPRAVDDRVTPFHIDGLDVRGRVVRLGTSLDAVLAHHDYPAVVKRLLGEHDDARAGDLAHLLLDQAQLAAGAPLADPGAFLQRMNRLLAA